MLSCHASIRLFAHHLPTTDGLRGTRASTLSLQSPRTRDRPTKKALSLHAELEVEYVALAGALCPRVGFGERQREYECRGGTVQDFEWSWLDKGTSLEDK